MHVRQIATIAGFAALLLLVTQSQSSAQPLTGPQLGSVPDIVAQTDGTLPPVIEAGSFYFGFGFRPRYYGNRRYYQPRRYRSNRSYRRRGGRCGYWSQRCINNWGYGGPNYRGCLRYHGCY
jgi:hypothetical protein